MRTDLSEFRIARAQADFDNRHTECGAQIGGDLQAKMEKAGSGTNEVVR